MGRPSWQPIRILGKGPWSLLPAQTWSVLTDLVIFAGGLALFYAVLMLARTWFGPFNPHVEISRSPTALPMYAAYSLLRITVAYVLSLAFTLVYGYIAAYNPRAERIMIPLLDILQSIPVLSFLPGVMLAMVALFPRHQLGIELGAILLIFTGQVWNMAFSFYSSLKSIPREMREAAKIYRFNWYQRFTECELPYAAIGLVWNSMMSVAGGWFFLMACEMFVLGSRDFRLPGLGSYLQTAASEGDMHSILWGVGVMIALIVLLDQIVWRPVIAWAEKFKVEQVESADAPRSWFLDFIQHSHGLIRLRKKTIRPLRERLALHFARQHHAAADQHPAGWKVWTGRAIGLIVLLSVLYAVVRATGMLTTLERGEYREIITGAAATFLRVLTALAVGAAWTIPVGVAIGFNPRLARIAQPLAQIAASVPATALFPIVMLALIRIGGGLGLGSVVLLLLGTQWYILFNVIAGASAFPGDFREAALTFHIRGWKWWREVMLPAIFPYYVTGAITASGGAWNASVVSEAVSWGHTKLAATGLGAYIAQMTAAGDFPHLALGIAVMSMFVILTNRLLWRPLYVLAENRTRLS